MVDLNELTPGQAEQLLRLEDLWPEYGHSLQVDLAICRQAGRQPPAH
jgi:hypothetical protein